MPTKRVSCGRAFTDPDHRSGRPPCGRGVLYADNMTDSMAKPSPKQSGAGRSSRPTTKRTAWCPQPRARGQQLDPRFLELSRKLKQDGPDADLVEVVGKAASSGERFRCRLALEALPELIDQLEAKMKEAAKLDFEAANLRDRVKQRARRWRVALIPSQASSGFELTRAPLWCIIFMSLRSLPADTLRM